MATPSYTRQFRQRSALARQSQHHAPKIGISKAASNPSASKPIPIPPTHIPRTKSELQLCEDTAAAEWRDLCMFHRLVSGIRERQHRQLAIQKQHEIADEQNARGGFKLNLTNLDSSASRSPVLQTERCIDNIILTRHNRAPQPIVKTQMVTPYDSPLELQGGGAPPTATNDPKPVHLRSVLRQASNIAQEVVASEDWSLEGYDNAKPLPDHGNLDTRIEPEEGDDDGAIFSLEL